MAELNGYLAAPNKNSVIKTVRWNGNKDIEALLLPKPFHITLRRVLFFHQTDNGGFCVELLAASTTENKRIIVELSGGVFNKNWGEHIKGLTHLNLEWDYKTPPDMIKISDFSGENDNVFANIPIKWNLNKED